MSNIITRINEDFIDDEVIDGRKISMDVRQNVQLLLAGLDTDIDFSAVNDPLYKPKDRKELVALIRMCLKKYRNECSLNWIDVSGRHNFSNIFNGSKFNGDISKWDVSLAIDMYQMFSGAQFNNDSLSGWDVRNVKNMNSMFKFSEFNGDISEWKPRRVQDMSYMFYGSKFDRDISDWYVKFITRTDMFGGCPIREEFKPLSMQSGHRERK